MMVFSLMSEITGSATITQSNICELSASLKPTHHFLQPKKRMTVLFFGNNRYLERTVWNGFCCRLLVYQVSYLRDLYKRHSKAKTLFQNINELGLFKGTTLI